VETLGMETPPKSDGSSSLPFTDNLKNTVPNTSKDIEDYAHFATLQEFVFTFYYLRRFCHCRGIRNGDVTAVAQSAGAQYVSLLVQLQCVGDALSSCTVTATNIIYFLVIYYELVPVIYRRNLS
jgi:hypothetical protein